MDCSSGTSTCKRALLLFRGKNNADQLKSLAPGIYIINGTKFVKK